MKEAAELDMTFSDFVDAYTRDMKPKLKQNTWLTKEHIIRTELIALFSKIRKCVIFIRKISFSGRDEQISHRDEKGKPYAPTSFENDAVRIECAVQSCGTIL